MVNDTQMSPPHHGMLTKSQIEIIENDLKKKSEKWPWGNSIAFDNNHFVCATEKVLDFIGGHFYQICVCVCLFLSHF